MNYFFYLLLPVFLLGKAEPIEDKCELKILTPALQSRKSEKIVLDNGLRVQAPIFIKEGEEVLVNTETGEYSARASQG